MEAADARLPVLAENEGSHKGRWPKVTEDLPSRSGAVIPEEREVPPANVARDC